MILAIFCNITKIGNRMNNLSSPPSSSLQAFFLAGERVVYKKGQVIVDQDEIPSGVYYIEQGFVRIYSTNQEGEEKVHAIYKAEEIFPLLWALRDIKKEFSYKTLDTTVLYKVKKKEFQTFVRQNSSHALELIDKLSGLLNIFMDRVDNLVTPKAYPRVISRLLFFANRFGRTDGREVAIAIPLTHSDIANSIAISRETASREIHKLIKKGLIAYKDRSIIIKDRDKLLKELLLLSGFAFSLVEQYF
ncbi:Crp/Fnr family transcriptional regulator [Candidatus Woesebacteria bacterium]|nr:Crp/Fnr family transcriptional regulator [Candidatus Woesebacteria bacterium]